MKKIRKIISNTLIYIISFCVLSGCSSSVSMGDENVNTYTITHFMGSTEDVNQYIESAKKEGLCQSIELDSSGRIVIEANDTQKKEWLNNSSKTIKNTLKEIDDKDEFEISLNDDYTTMEVKASGNRNMKKLGADIATIIYNAEVYQVFNGQDDWKVNFSIYDTDVDKEIYKVTYPEEGIEVNDDLWSQDRGEYAD